MSALKVIQVPAAFNTAGLNIVWILVGLIAIYAGIKNLLDEENPSGSSSVPDAGGGTSSRSRLQSSPRTAGALFAPFTV